jgi:hypothetical protein
VSIATFPMTAAPRTHSSAVGTAMCTPLGTDVFPAVNALELDVRGGRIDVAAYDTKQGRPPRGVPR